MMRNRVPSVLAASALALSTVLGAAAPPAVAKDDGVRGPWSSAQQRPELQAALDAWIDKGFLGMTMRLRDEGGEWVGSSGLRKLGAPGLPPTDGVFWGGSITKPFTAVMVLQLVDEGRIGLDSSVAGYLPELDLDPRITVRMLLNHTSGLFNYTGEYYSNPERVEPGIPAAGVPWIENRFARYAPEDLVAVALSKDPRFTPPGSNHSYSNTNYTLALLLIERVTGMSYSGQLRQRIVEPLRLRNTLVPGQRTQLPGPHAHGYVGYRDDDHVWTVVDVTRQNLSLLAGAGNLVSSTRDLSTFITALLDGRLVPEPLLSEMLTPDPLSGAYGYGLGIFVQDLGPGCETVVHHNGSAPGGYGALMISALDGSPTVTASLTTGDAEIDVRTAYESSLAELLRTVFCTS